MTHLRDRFEGDSPGINAPSGINASLQVPLSLQRRAWARLASAARSNARHSQLIPERFRIRRRCYHRESLGHSNVGKEQPALAADALGGLLRD
jgi:hypothetical protein